MTDFKVNIDPTAVLVEEVNTLKEALARERTEVQSLTVALKYEQAQRRERDQRIAKLEEELYGEARTKRKRRTKAEMEEFRRKQNGGEYSELKSDGRKKATATDYFHSYTDYKKMEDYLRNNKTKVPYKPLRDVMMLRMGVCFGVRASDLVSLKWKNLFNEQYEFLDRIKIYEQKTSKLQNCLITEAVREIVLEYLDCIRWDIDLNDYVLCSTITRGNTVPIEPKTTYDIIVDAEKKIGLGYHLGSHSMRRTFANIVACVDKSTIDMNTVSKVQGLLNHSNPTTTMRYMGTLKNMYDNSRKVVSDFVLGKTEVDELVAGNNISMEDVMNKLDSLIDNQK